MALDTICSPSATDVIQGIVYPLTAISATVTTLIVALSYMVGTAIANPRITLWAKTEVMQLFISLLVVGVVLQAINTFCAVDIGPLYSALSGGTAVVAPGTTFFSAANAYLVEGGTWIHELLHSTRYHIGGYSILQMFGRNKCEDVGDEWNWLFCLFGAAISSAGGASGASSTTVAPDSGYGLLTSALGVSYNTITFSYLSILNYIFILRYVFSGFVLFFLPLGIFLRALPYMRTLGSLLMSVAISFLIIYPFILSAFYIDFKSARILVPTSDAFLYVYENPGEWRDIGTEVDLSNAFSGSLYSDVFDDGEQTVEIIKLTGNAFLVGVFIPSLALLGAAAAVTYINRFLGEEVDLSRIVQLM